jgi:hypothetical protein
MTKQLAVIVLLLAAHSVAQEGLTIQGSGKLPIAADAQNIYLSACAAVRREFGVSPGASPRMTLVLGAQKDEAVWQTHEIRLRKWNRDLFAQGVVLLAFDDIMTSERRLRMAKRALNWADSTVDAAQLVKQSSGEASR